VRRLYGASVADLLALLAGGVVSAYAVTRVSDLNTLTSIAVWFAFMLVAHDLILFPIYAALDNAATRLRQRSGSLVVPWTNYARVPAVLSGFLLLAWFPLVFRLPSGFAHATARSDDDYLWHWLAITAILFAGSGLLYLRRLLSRRHYRAPLHQQERERT
jgi:hypothetical protein